MRPYRCYFLDDANHIVKVEACEYGDDASAIRWAETLRRDPGRLYGTELWCRDRLVERRERAFP